MLFGDTDGFYDFYVHSYFEYACSYYLITLTAIFEISLPPLLNSKMAKTQSRELGSSGSDVKYPTRAYFCMQGDRVFVCMGTNPHTCVQTLTLVTLHAKVGKC